MIDAKTISKIAKLSRIDITGQEDSRAQELNSIFGWIEQLQEVDTEGVATMASVGDATLRFREDKITDGDQKQAILENAPASAYDCFTVPKVVE